MKDLTTGSVTRHLVHMSAFLAMSMAVQTLYLLADLYWVGHLGKEAIAAVGVAGNITMIVLALTQMLGVGTTTLIAQAAGRKDQVRAEHDRRGGNNVHFHSGRRRADGYLFRKATSI
jgi:Na+-driven multidrug efflux pump